MDGCPRTLTKAHIADLALLEEACFERPWTAQEFEHCLSQDYFHAFGIIENNSLVAYLTCSIVVDEMEIVNVAVRKDRRQQGLGQRLLARVMQLARDHHLYRIILEVRRSNDIARRWYDKNGFVRVGERIGYYSQEGEDALIMAWTPSPS